ncbi:MAG: peptidylprolyl isomerase [Chitinophagaceae bacterium]|nr:peptidylprolyl isomerase [Chitinophagaceae bacterium]
MKKSIAALTIACFILLSASSQTLFTYGKYKADVNDFLNAYNKNNPGPTTNKSKAVNEYLTLYINSKLKIREDYDRRFDTLPQIISEVANLRTQISENYMSDPELVKRMTGEAFNRSLKDIRVAHIFISYRNAAGFVDTVEAKKKRDAILQRLKKGDDFSLVAKENSDDPSAKNNKGELGYITVFTLPYEFENVIYATPVGKYSSEISSKVGYHIFKKMGERKAVGKIKAQQILLAFPPDVDEAGKKQLGKLADSLYKLLLAGENFNRLASSFSNDYVTAANGGIMADAGVGQYEPAFESALWAISKDGAITKPFATSYGLHILKRNSVKPVVTDPNDKGNLLELEQRIKTDSRWKSSKDFIYNQVKSKAGFKKYPIDNDGVWAMSDSVLDQKPMLPVGRSIIASTTFFTIGDSTYDATDWVNYANTYRYKQDGTGAKPWPQVMDEFEKFAMLSFYRDRLEDFNEDFRNQMAEFKDGNIFFEIMQQEVWNKAQSDSATLLALYETNKAKYKWEKSADVIVLFCSDQTIANTAYDLLKKNPADWRNIVEQHSEKIVADSSRYEWEQIPNLNKAIPKTGMITSPLLNTNDNTASFAYLAQVYDKPMQRSYQDAKGLVINDYQTILEDKWNEALRKKYPVTIDQKVLSSISK